MIPGDRVMTPDGDGIVLELGSKRVWAGLRSRAVGWVKVVHEDGSERTHNPLDVRVVEPKGEARERHGNRAV